MQQKYMIFKSKVTLTSIDNLMYCIHELQDTARPWRPCVYSFWCFHSARAVHGVDDVHDVHHNHGVHSVHRPSIAPTLKTIQTWRLLRGIPLSRHFN